MSKTLSSATSLADPGPVVEDVLAPVPTSEVPQYTG